MSSSTICLASINWNPFFALSIFDSWNFNFSFRHFYHYYEHPDSTSIDDIVLYGQEKMLFNDFLNTFYVIFPRSIFPSIGKLGFVKIRLDLLAGGSLNKLLCTTLCEKSISHTEMRLNLESVEK